MPGFNPEKLNIHDLAIKEPEKQRELYFDAKRDISEEDWAGIEHSLEGYKNKIFFTDLSLFSSLAKSVKIIDPERKIPFNKYDINEIKNSLQRERKTPLSEKIIKDKYIFSNRWYDFALQAARLKIFSPEDAFEINSEDWDGIEKSLELQANDMRDMNGLALLAMNIKILNPQKKLDGIDINLDDHWKKNRWERLEKSLQEDKEKGDWQAFTSKAMAMKIIGLEEDIKISKSDWESIIFSLNENRKDKRPERKNWLKFCSMAAAIIILEADEVKITDAGLELINKPNLLTGTATIPEQRNF